MTFLLANNEPISVLYISYNVFSTRGRYLNKYIELQPAPALHTLSFQFVMPRCYCTIDTHYIIS